MRGTVKRTYLQRRMYTGCCREKVKVVMRIKVKVEMRRQVKGKMKEEGTEDVAVEK